VVYQIILYLYHWLEPWENTGTDINDLPLWKPGIFYLGGGLLLLIISLFKVRSRRCPATWSEWPVVKRAGFAKPSGQNWSGTCWSKSFLSNFKNRNGKFSTNADMLHTVGFEIVYNVVNHL
jgi:hypothetical protein